MVSLDLSLMAISSENRQVIKTYNASCKLDFKKWKSRPHIQGVSELKPCLMMAILVWNAPMFVQG